MGAAVVVSDQRGLPRRGALPRGRGRRPRAVAPRPGGRHPGATPPWVLLREGSPAHGHAASSAERVATPLAGADALGSRLTPMVAADRGPAMRPGRCSLRSAGRARGAGVSGAGRLRRSHPETAHRRAVGRSIDQSQTASRPPAAVPCGHPIWDGALEQDSSDRHGHLVVGYGCSGMRSRPPARRGSVGAARGAGVRPKRIASGIGPAGGRPGRVPSSRRDTTGPGPATSAGRRRLVAADAPPSDRGRSITWARGWAAGPARSGPGAAREDAPRSDAAGKPDPGCGPAPPPAGGRPAQHDRASGPIAPRPTTDRDLPRHRTGLDGSSKTPGEALVRVAIPSPRAASGRGRRGRRGARRDGRRGSARRGPGRLR